MPRLASRLPDARSLRYSHVDRTTIDGQARGLRGNIAHAFQRRWPEAYEDFEAQLRFPIPLGSAIRIDADTDCPWRLQTPEAYRTMHDAWLGSPLHRSGGSLLVCCLDGAEYEAPITERRRLMAT